MVEILDRKKIQVVGTFQKTRKDGQVIPDEPGRDIFIHRKNTNHARSGQKVMAEITGWSGQALMPEGRIVHVLGYPGEKGVDVLSVVYRFQLPTSFPSLVEKEAERIPLYIDRALNSGRLDLRGKLVLTIDPDDAKDFDDAVSLERLSDSEYELGVHIADVSHFVPVGSALDREALIRGTSVYLVDRVIPMLPERLSNELCSLKPDEDKLTYSVMMRITPEGIVNDYQIRESVIRSRHRLSYGQAQRLINHPKSSSNLPRADITLSRTLSEMAVLSQKLKGKWRKEGLIDFDAPEAEIIMNEAGNITDIRPKERLESHQLIEAFMLLANRTVAEHIETLRQEGRKLSFVYRIHEKPKGNKLDEFVRFVRALGYPFDPGKRITPKKFQSVLDRVKGTPHEIIVEEVALRTMMKAVYSTQNVGHFGLAFKHYTHFTSPIRRYPDLTVHRLLKATQMSEPKKTRMAIKLSEVCQISTEREIVAQEAERESLKVKQTEFMKDKIGEEYEGVISGVTAFGIFVEIPQYLIEGLVHIRDLGDETYIHEEKHYRLVGKYGGRVFRLGDSVRVRVVRADPETRRIDFILAEEMDPAAKIRSKMNRGKKKGKGKRSRD